MIHSTPTNQIARDGRRGSVRPFRVEALHTLALFALAIAQPVFSTIGEAPEFLVAHNATPLVIVAFAVGLALIAPLAIIAVEWLVSRIYRPAGKVLHGLVVLVLLGIIAQQVLDRFLDLDVKLLLGLSLLLAVLASLLYWRSATVSRMVSIAAIGALLLPLNFLFVSPASRLVLSKGGDVFGEVSPPKKTPPIVFIVFDEFNPTVLLDENKQIDEVRYPNFAALAKDSWWFPRATSPYHLTTAAVPAILTGKRPGAEQRLPTFADHPRNLFTMLGENYRMNVHELLTSLCPGTICKNDKKEFSSGRFGSDVLVILGHSLLPQEIASEHLPSLAGGWHGFGARQDSAFDQQFLDIQRAMAGKLKKKTKPRFIDDFIDTIGGEDHLNFLHVLLPHAPYEFFPSGMMYNSTRYGFGSDRDVWGDNQDLINLDYQRYMLQVGLLDRKIGELIDRLKEKEIYDDALIIVTADHSRTFSRKHFIRKMTTENAELLHVPLIVKRPGQKEGRVSDASVSTLDILPTIADELGIEHVWDLDGAGLFSSDFPEREWIALNVNGEEFEFPWEEVVRLPLLDWQLRTFPPRHPLDDLQVSHRYSDLIGDDIATLSGEISPRGSGVRLLQNLHSFTSVDFGTGFLPAVIDSQITGEVQPGSWVLFALNGKVASVSQVYAQDEDAQHVSALLPEKLFLDGFNKLEVFLFIDEGEERRLIPVDIETTTFQVDAGRSVVTSSAGQEYPIRPKERFGHVDMLRLEGGSLAVSGWSVDSIRKKSTDTVAIFSGEEFVCATNPSGTRPDVARHFESPDAVLSGFSIVCPLQDADVDRSQLKIFGISKSGEAGELLIPPA